eukprot:7519438-Pyramimonas_sp.AAC.1
MGEIPPMGENPRIDRVCWVPRIVPVGFIVSVGFIVPYSRRRPVEYTRSGHQSHKGRENIPVAGGPSRSAWGNSQTIRPQGQ